MIVGPMFTTVELRFNTLDQLQSNDTTDFPVCYIYTDCVNNLWNWICYNLSSLYKKNHYL